MSESSAFGDNLRFCSKLQFSQFEHESAVIVIDQIVIQIRRLCRFQPDVKKSHGARRIHSRHTIDAFADSMQTHGMRERVRFNNGPEMIPKSLREWLSHIRTQTLYITPVSTWKTGCCESFNGKQRGELLIGQIFHTLREALVLFERWRVFYNTVRPHSSPAYRPSAPETVSPIAVVHKPVQAA